MEHISLKLMDSLSSQMTYLSSTVPNSNVDKNHSKPIFTLRSRFYETYLHQDFSLPDSVIFYIAKNPSTPEVYQKLIQSCKYFFDKLPLLVMSNLYIEYEIAKPRGWRYCFNRQPFDYRKTIKLWVTDEMKIYNFFYEKEEQHNFLSSFMPNIYQCDAKIVELCDQNISFDDFIMLASNAEEIHLGERSQRSNKGPVPSIKNEDGTVVALEKLVAALPKLKKFNFFFHQPIDGIVTSNTAKELIQLPHFPNLNKFDLVMVPESFDINTFYEYMKKNKKTSFLLRFCDQLSDEYKRRLQKITDEIIEFENRDFKEPLIYFLGMDLSSFKNLGMLFYEHHDIHA